MKVCSLSNKPKNVWLNNVYCMKENPWIHFWVNTVDPLLHIKMYWKLNKSLPKIIPQIDIIIFQDIPTKLQLSRTSPQSNSFSFSQWPNKHTCYYFRISLLGIKHSRCLTHQFPIFHYQLPHYTMLQKWSNSWNPRLSISWKIDVDE